MSVTAVDLYSQPVQLPGGRWHLSAFHATTDADVHADHWEVHDDGDEIVSCLDGGMRLYLRAEGHGDDEFVTLTRGTAVVIPRGRWHRIELDEPSDLLAITVWHGTRLEKRAMGSLY